MRSYLRFVETLCMSLTCAKGEDKYLRSFFPRTWARLLGSNSILSVHGEAHKRQRSLLTQAFSPR